MQKETWGQGEAFTNFTCCVWSEVFSVNMHDFYNIGEKMICSWKKIWKMYSQQSINARRLCIFLMTQNIEEFLMWTKG